jgi:hypothetical protein
MLGFMSAMVEDDPPLPTYAVTLSQLPLRPGQKLEYLFDFGDSWQFDLLIESIDAAATAAKRIRVIESHGKPPPQYEFYE